MGSIYPEHTECLDIQPTHQGRLEISKKQGRASLGISIDGCKFSFVPIFNKKLSKSIFVEIDVCNCTHWSTLSLWKSSLIGCVSFFHDSKWQWRTRLKKLWSRSTDRAYKLLELHNGAWSPGIPRLDFPGISECLSGHLPLFQAFTEFLDFFESYNKFYCSKYWFIDDFYYFYYTNNHRGF